MPARPDLRPRVFIGFYGLNRSLDRTWRSIRNKFLLPFERTALEVTITCHFHKPDRINSLRSGETNVRAIDKGYANFPNPVVRICPQEPRVLPEELRYLLRPIDETEDAQTVQDRRNLLYQLRSLSEVYGMMLDQGAGPDDLYFFLRPDLRYLDELDVEDVRTRLTDGGYDILTASWHEWRGLNDRFAFCNAAGAEVYAKRIECVEKHMERHGELNAECLLGEVVRQSGLSHGHVTTRAMRVRADGFTHREGFCISPIDRIPIALLNRWARLKRSVAKNGAKLFKSEG